MALHRLIIIPASQTCTVLLICIISSTATSQDTGCNQVCEYNEDDHDLNCDSKGLDTVPRGCSSSMTQIDLRNNNLMELGPGSLEGYISLENLHLEHNKITNITRGAFEGCVSLNNLYLQDNVLKRLGEWVFEGATALETLVLSGNLITNLHPGAFRGLDNLQSLHINDNHLQTLPQGIYENLIHLEYLNLQNNNLRSFEGSVFDPLKNLLQLDLSENAIASVRDFPTLPNLRKLDLFGNNIRDIGALSDKVDGLNELYLAYNIIDCTCSVNPVREWLRRYMYNLYKSYSNVGAIRANVTCQEPQHLHGQALYLLTGRALCPTGVPPIQPSSTTEHNTPVISESADPTYRTIQQMADPTYRTIQPMVTEKDGVSFSTEGLTPPTEKEKVYRQTESSDRSKPMATITYIAAGSGMLAVVVLILVILMICLSYRCNRRYPQQQARNRQLPNQWHHQHHHHPSDQNLTPVRVTVNRHIEEDDDDDSIYEPVGPQLNSLIRVDSAIGSEDDLNATDETQSWLDPTYLIPSCGSEGSRHPSPPSMSAEQWVPMHSVSAPLAQERLNTNPFLRNMPQDDQAASFAEGCPTEMLLNTVYVPHTVFVQGQAAGLWQTPQQNPQETVDHNMNHLKHSYSFQPLKHVAQKLPRRRNTNPFDNSTSINPFITSV